ncbi:hypothetical protein ACOXXX_13860 [Thalassococcus sp. BH17M4-6]|uniref:hypothetical protein n=1 Tax=Thalassococcus sp. BH17M4-6 TaxID=3413148 RepID=UPI003BEE1042
MSNIVPDRNRLPELMQRYLPASRQERLAPFVYAGGMVAVGLTLLLAKPRIGNVPRSALAGDGPVRSRRRRAAQKSRDVVAPFAPGNVTDSIGRSLLIGGVALGLTRLLDELSDSRRG